MAKKERHVWYLKEWRKHRRLTQDQLADKAGLSKPYISQLERNVRQYTQETLEQLADALGCDVADLVGRPPESVPHVVAIWGELSPAEQEQAIKVITVLKQVKP